MVLRYQPQGRAQVDATSALGRNIKALIIPGKPELVGGALPVVGGSFMIGGAPVGLGAIGPTAQVPGHVWYTLNRPAVINGDFTIVLYASSANVAAGVRTHTSDVTGALGGADFTIGSTSASCFLDGNPSASLSGDYTKPTLFTGRRIGNQVYITAGKQKSTAQVTGTRTGSITAFTFGRDHAGSNNGTQTTSYLCAIFDRALTDTEIDKLVDNPWSLFKSEEEDHDIVVASGSDTSINPTTGTLSLTGYAPTINQTANQSLTAGAGTLTITGYAPTVSQTSSSAITPSVGTLTITGYAPSITQPQSATAGFGTLTITGYTPTIDQSPTQSGPVVNWIMKHQRRRHCRR